MTTAVLGFYFIWDTRVYARETPMARRRDRAQVERLRVRGAANGVGLGLVILAVAFLHAPWREVAIVNGGGALDVAHAGRDPPRQRFHVVPRRI